MLFLQRKQALGCNKTHRLVVIIKTLLIENMKKILFLLLLFPLIGFGQKIVTDDIDRFWKAYDAIVQERDSVKQVDLIRTLYISQGSPGLAEIMKARRYSAEEYIYAINHYPQFWKSIRKNTLKAVQISKKIGKAQAKLKKIYPGLKPADTYFEIGVLRTGGTTGNGMILIGSEVALADKTVVTHEFDKKYPHLRSYFDTNPVNDAAFLNIHEYLHTQQKETIGNTLLAQTLMEGVAELMAEIAMNVKSPNPQIEFGYKNEARIKEAYEKEMFSSNIYNWIMNSPDNQFKMRDLGYFVGYAICKKYYDQAPDKKLAIKEMIELDYNHEDDLIKFVEKTQYFNRPLLFYKNEFEKSRPVIIGINQFKNGSADVDPAIKTFSVTFSQPMDSRFRNFDIGPLGESNVLKIKKAIGFSADKKSFIFEADIEPGKQYQILFNRGFRSQDGFPLVPYLIDFKTKNKSENNLH